MKSTHPDILQSFVLLVKVAIDVVGVEQGVPGDLAEQVAGEVTDVVLAEVPLPQHTAGDHRLCVLVAALAEVAAQVFTVAQSLDVVCSGQETKGERWGVQDLGFNTKWMPWEETRLRSIRLHEIAVNLENNHIGINYQFIFIFYGFWRQRVIQK